MELTKESLSSIQFKLKGNKYYYAEEVDKTIDTIIQLAEKQHYDIERAKRLEQDSALRTNKTLQEEAILKKEVARLQAREHEFEHPGVVGQTHGEDTQRLGEKEQELARLQEALDQQMQEISAERARLQQAVLECDTQKQSLASMMSEARAQAQAQAQAIVQEARVQAQALVQEARVQGQDILQEARMQAASASTVGTSGETLQSAQGQAESIVQEAQAQAEAILQEARTRAQAAVENVQVQARTRAEAIVQEARAQAETIVQQAQAQALQTRAEALSEESKKSTPCAGSLVPSAVSDIQGVPTDSVQQEKSRKIVEEYTRKIATLKQEIEQLESYKRSSLLDLQEKYQKCWTALDSLTKE